MRPERRADTAQLPKLVTVGLTLVCLHASLAAGWVVVAIALILAGILLALGVCLYRNRSVPLIASLLAGALLFGMALALYLAGIKSIGRVLTVPSFLVLAALSLVFGKSLLQGEEPIVTRFMRLDLGSVPDRAAKYGRQLTAMWTVLLAAMALESLVLSLLVDLSLWSWLVNVANPVLLILFFVGQHVYGSRFLPERRRASPISTLKAMLHGGVWFNIRAQQPRGER